jgi:hypothetical protein
MASTTWQSRLQKLVRVIEELPEPLNDYFLVEPPSGKSWPKELPPCPALKEFYTLCDGGTFSHYSLHSLDEVHEFDEGDDVGPEGYVTIGDTEFGHSLVWDSAKDQVGYYDFDGADGFVMSEETGAELMGRTMADFLAGLFSPPRRTKGDKVQQMWSQVLIELDRVDD